MARTTNKKKSRANKTAGSETSRKARSGTNKTLGDGKAKIRETDVYKPVHDYLEALGYNVQGEVKGCDMAALLGDELVVVELKTSFNLKLLSQAVKRQRAADSVYVAIPHPKGGARTAGWRDMCMLLRRLELGLITVSPEKTEGQVEVHFHPNTFDRLKSMKSGKRVRHHIIKETVSRSGNYNVGGCNKKKLVTAYREQAIHIACCLMKLGPLSPSKLRKIGASNKTPDILSDNHYGWFSRISRGIYTLNECANEFLKEYPELVQHYISIVPESIEEQVHGKKKRKEKQDAQNIVSE